MKSAVDKPLVSIVTPTLNGLKYLEVCVQSVLNQSYPNIEHIFVDGGSTDGTLDMLTSYQTKYSGRIRCISETDKSAGEAWVKGLRMANGRILGWLGTDDTYELDAIQTVVESFRSNPDAYFIFGGCNYINERGEVIKKVVTKDFDLEEAINDVCSIPCTSAFYKREVIEKVSPNIIAEQDSELEYWIIVGKVFKIHRIENLLSNFRLYTDKARDHNDMYSFARTTFMMGRRHGAGIFSPCTRRYILALAIRPLQLILDPIFHFMSTGDADRGNLLVRVTHPFHPILGSLYHFMVGSKRLGKK